MDRGAWWAAVHGVTQSQTLLKHLSMHACIGEGNGNPLQCSCLENPRDRGAWWPAVYEVAQSWTQLKRLSSSSSKPFYASGVFINVHLIMFPTSGLCNILNQKGFKSKDLNETWSPWTLSRISLNQVMLDWQKCSADLPLDDLCLVRAMFSHGDWL